MELKRQGEEGRGEPGANTHRHTLEVGEGNFQDLRETQEGTREEIFEDSRGWGEGA